MNDRFNFITTRPITNIINVIVGNQSLRNKNTQSSYMLCIKIYSLKDYKQSNILEHNKVKCKV